MDRGEDCVHALFLFVEFVLVEGAGIYGLIVDAPIAYVIQVDMRSGVLDDFPVLEFSWSIHNKFS